MFYCLFHYGTGLYVAPGVRILAPGFWLLLAGFSAAVVSDLALLVMGGGAAAVRDLRGSGLRQKQRHPAS